MTTRGWPLRSRLIFGAFGMLIVASAPGMLIFHPFLVLALLLTLVIVSVLAWQRRVTDRWIEEAKAELAAQMDEENSW